jgi:hypothetical protein
MQNISLAMAALLLFPTVAVAQSEDTSVNHDQSLDLNFEPTRDGTLTTSDQYQMDPQMDNKPKDGSDFENVDGPKNSADPLIIEPKFDFGSKLPHEADVSTKPYLPEPEPAAGLAIKIPTN